MSNTKRIFALLCLCLSLSAVGLGQTENPQPLQQVKITFRNNSIVFRKVTLVTYFPIEPGNSTEGKVLAPYSSITKTYPVGTKVYLANGKQVEVVMSGKRLEDKPFLTVTAEDEGKTFNIFKE